MKILLLSAVELFQLTLVFAAHFPEHLAAVVKDDREVSKSRGAELHLFECQKIK